MDEFGWDSAKAEANVKNHNVSFEEALTVFTDPLAAIFDDPDHSAAERRELIIGQSTKQDLLVVSFTERAGRVRIITARKVTPGNPTRATRL